MQRLLTKNLPKPKKSTANTKSYDSCFSVQGTIEMVDMFKKPLPAFNIRGSSEVASYCGAFTSVLISLILTVYGLSKFI